MPRAGVTPKRVLEVAVGIVEQDGAAALTLTGVAAALGIATPSLYKHVGGLEELRARVAVVAAQRLADEIGTAVQGLAGADALRALARAYRGFAHHSPGLYPLTQEAQSTTGEEYRVQAGRALDVVAAALSGYGIPAASRIDAIRLARSTLHGFVDLELRDGFGMVEPVDRSFDVLMTALDAALRELGKD